MKLRKLLLFIAVFAAAAITGCKEDPIIEPVEVTLSQTEIKAEKTASESNITLTVNREWTIEKELVAPMEGETDTDWVTISPDSGNASADAQAISVKISANSKEGAYEREMNIYFKTESIYAVLNVHQDGITKPSSYKLISISALRAMAPSDKSSKDKVEITKPLKIKAVVVSSSEPQTVSSKNLFVQDGTKKNSGILIYTNSATIWETCKFGDSVEVVLTNGNLVFYNKLLEFIPADDLNITILNSGNKVEAAKVEGKDIIKGFYEGQYVKVFAQVRTADLSKKMGESPKVETKDTTETFMMYSRNSAGACPDWATTAVPQGAGDLMGLVSSYSGVYQLVPQFATDFGGMTGERFSGEEPDPEVTTGESSDVTTNSATLAASYTYAGSKTISEVGVAWKVEGAESYTYAPAAAVAGEFTVALTGLTTGATYKYAGYAKIDEKYFLGSEKAFTTTDPSAAVLKTIAEIRAMASATDTVTIKDNIKIVGIAVSNRSTETGNNIHNKSLALQDDSAVNSGIIVRFNNAHSIDLATETQVLLQGTTLSFYNGVLQINLNSDDAVSSLGVKTLPSPISVSVEQLSSGKYEAMYISIANAKVDAAHAGQKFYVKDGNKGNIKMNIAGTEDTFVMYSTSYCVWKDEVLPTGTGVIKGLGGVYTKDSKSTYQIQPQRASDYEYLVDAKLQSISTLRAKMGDSKTVVAEDWIIKGIVVSNVSSETGGNINNKSVILQDNTAPNSGICVRFTDSANNKFQLGDEVQVVVKDGALSIYSGTLRFAPTADAQITKTEKANNQMTPVKISVADLKTGKYESMYVSVDKVKVDAAHAGQKFYDDTNKGNVNVDIDGTDDTFVMYTSKYSVWKNEVLPTGTGVLKGIGGTFTKDSNTTYQIMPQIASDYAALK